MALKKQHKARWNCNMGKYQLGRGTWTTPQNGKWPYLKFRQGTYIPPPPPPHTCPTLQQTYAWLCLISHCIFVRYSYTFVQNFPNNTMPCINLSEHWTTLPPSKSKPLKSHGFEDNLMVSRWGTKISQETDSQADGIHFLNIFIFASKNWFSCVNYVEIHSSPAYSSLFVIFDHLVDKINAR